MLTKEQMVDKIYEVISDKTLSFWCIVVLRNNEKDFRNNKKMIYCESQDRWDKYFLKEFWSNIMPLYPYNFEDLFKEDENLDKIPVNLEIIWHPVMINRIEWYFLKNDATYLLHKLLHKLSVEYYLLPIEDWEEKKIKQLYDNLLVLWCK
jgi:hypothetical protein